MIVNLQDRWGVSKGCGKGSKWCTLGGFQGAQTGFQQHINLISRVKDHTLLMMCRSFLVFFPFSLITWIQASFYDYVAPITWS